MNQKVIIVYFQGDVDLKIVYDDDVYGARILAEVPSASSEEESTVCNHVIAMQTNLTDGVWSALDFSTDPPSHRTFRVEFDNIDVEREFKDMFAEGKCDLKVFYFFHLSHESIVVGKELAEQSEILETVGEQDPSEFYYGQGQDED